MEKIAHPDIRRGRPWSESRRKAHRPPSKARATNYGNEAWQALSYKDRLHEARGPVEKLRLTPEDVLIRHGRGV